MAARRLLLDTNVLLLLVVGTVDPALVEKHRRTRVFTRRDFDLLQEEVGRYRMTVTTPAVLAEVSNLLGNDFHVTAAEAMVTVCGTFVEVVRPKEEVFALDAFERLGFTDSSILAVTDEQTVVLTDDVALYSQVWYSEREAVNFNHLRMYGR